MPLSNPTKGNKHQDKDQETQRRILIAAKRLFQIKGFKGVSMKDIADEVQVTAAALYYHFPEGKQELFIRMIMQTLEDWSTQTFEQVEQAEGLRARLLKLAELMLERQMSTYMGLMRDLEEFCRDKIDKRDIRKIHRRDLVRVTAIFQQAIEDGEISPAIPATTYSIMYQGMVMGVQFEQRFTSNEENQIIKPLDVQQNAQMIVNSLLDGIMLR